MSAPKLVHTITRADVGSRTIVKRCPCCGSARSWISITDMMGEILPGDVGKRVYQVGQIFQVENDQQRDARQ